MGLTFESAKKESLMDIYKIEKNIDEFIIALAGNPNTGKSTVFNSLTGLHQHTGNWPGKTVVNARGEYFYKDKRNILVDLPGTYSLFAASVEEEVARDFICFGNSDGIIVVTDATCLERNLNLVFQIMEFNKKVVLCINLIDEAKKKNIKIDRDGLEKELGIPVVLTAARKGYGIEELKDKIYKVMTEEIKTHPKKIKYQEYIEELINEIESLIKDEVIDFDLRWVSLRILDSDEAFLKQILLNLEEGLFNEIVAVRNRLYEKYDRKGIRDDITGDIYNHIEKIKEKYIKEDRNKINRDRIVDNFVTSRIYGIPLMLLTLAFILWLTISGANVPSEIIGNLLFSFEEKLGKVLVSLNSPKWLYGILIEGMYRTMAWVVSVMLPPMAIFFPLFTLLEDLGYLPRIAFNLDHLFKKASAHGKQCLTMCMGFGCNAAGVISCRIIDSPRERLIAILTNNFVPCNGRFPTLIALSTIFFAAQGSVISNIIPTVMVTLLVLLGIFVTLLTSYWLSKTILKGIPSTFTLELPPYRVPQIGRVLYTSLIDRTIFVLWRAIIVAAPAGMVIWILNNITIEGINIINHLGTILDPIGKIIGLDGYILVAFILGLPANEIVLPILLMTYLATGTMVEFESLESLKEILINNGWSSLTALNVMLFSLLHWPCGTTLFTIKKETGSLKWTALACIIPTAIAYILCFITNLIYNTFLQ